VHANPADSAPDVNLARPACRRVADRPWGGLVELDEIAGYHLEEAYTLPG